MKIIPFTVLVLALSANAQPTTTPDENAEKINTAPTSVPEKEDVGTVIPSDKAYPTGPYKNGKYEEKVGEERQAEEERIKEAEDKTRVNRFGPNKL